MVINFQCEINTSDVKLKRSSHGTYRRRLHVRNEEREVSKEVDDEGVDLAHDGRVLRELPHHGAVRALGGRRLGMGRPATGAPATRSLAGHCWWWRRRH